MGGRILRVVPGSAAAGRRRPRDLYGRRKVFAFGVALFSAASALCGCSPDIRWLIVTRGVQGVGGALLVPGSLALISANFSESERGRAIGTWSGFTAITAAAGPVLGGWLTQHGSWRWVFFINVPVGLAVLLLTVWKVPESSADQRRGFDWAGGLLAVLGFGGIVFALINSRPAIGFAGATFLIALLYLGDALIVPDAPSQSVPFPQFQRREPVDPLSLLRLKRHAVLLPTRFDPSARVYTDPGRRRASSFHPVDVSVIALVGWTSGSIWRKASLGDRPFSRRNRICTVHPVRHRRVVLDNVFPGARRAWTWHGDQRGPADHDSDELSRSEPCRDCVGSE